MDPVGNAMGTFVGGRKTGDGSTGGDGESARDCGIRSGSGRVEEQRR